MTASGTMRSSGRLDFPGLREPSPRLPLRSGRGGRNWSNSELVIYRPRFRADRNETAAAAIIPAAAVPARLYIVIRSAVQTRGSGGRP